MKRAATLLGVAVVVIFGVIVVRETAAVVVLARSFDPRLGQAVLWLLLAIYAVCLGIPAVLFLRLRAPLVPPPLDADPDTHQRHRDRLARRLSRHRLLAQPVAAEPAAIEQALAVLDRHAERHIRREAALVFLSTAISQSGRLDGLFVLVAQTRLVWKIARVYWQRPTLREFLVLYANVGATVFAAQSLEDLDLAEALEPVIPPVIQAAGLGATVVLAPVGTVVAEAMFQGTVNALLTLRVGCITRRYCRGLPLPDRRAVRRSASREAAVMLPRLIAEPARRLRAEVMWRAVSDVGGAARSVVTAVTGSVGDAVRQATTGRRRRAGGSTPPGPA
jgi:hypothetical protein